MEAGELTAEHFLARYPSPGGWPELGAPDVARSRYRGAGVRRARLA
jgi:hypothetical protein